MQRRSAESGAAVCSEQVDRSEHFMTFWSPVPDCSKMTTETSVLMFTPNVSFRVMIPQFLLKVNRHVADARIKNSSHSSMKYHGSIKMSLPC